MVRSENIRLLWTMAAREKWIIVTIDVKTAFLYAPLNKPVYLKIPRGAPFDRGKFCWLLTKALYGLRESPAAWSVELTKTLLKLGFTKCQSDWNFYYKRTTKGNVVFVVFHVDDGLLTGNNRNVLETIIQELQKFYTLQITWDPKLFLGIELLKYDDGSIQLLQTDYISECAAKFKLLDSRPIKLPMETSFRDVMLPIDKPVTTEPYRSIIGCLGHIARNTRPDILYAFSILSKYLSNATLRHWNAAKRVLIYLYHTRNDGLLFSAINAEHVVCYSDSTWADNEMNRRSRTGGCLFFYGNLISYWSKQQATVALSSTDAEYQALAYCVQMVYYFRQLLLELHLIELDPVQVYCDNKGALDLAVSTKNHPRVKHVDLKFHFTREALQAKVIALDYVSTSANIADFFTKALDTNLFQKFKLMLNIQTRRGIS